MYLFIWLFVVWGFVFCACSFVVCLCRLFGCIFLRVCLFVYCVLVVIVGLIDCLYVGLRDCLGFLGSLVVFA